MTTKKTFLTFIFAFFVALSSMAEDVREVDRFEKIGVAGSFEVKLIKSDKNEVRISNADDETLEKIETVVERSTLKIRFRRNTNYRYKRGGTIEIKVFYTERLEGLALAGSGSIDWKGILHSEDDFDISIAGSGDMDGEIAVSEVNISVAGSGDIRLAGAATRQNVNIAGSGDYSGDDLKSVKAEVNVSGSGNADIYVTQSLEANVAGSGDVRYRTGGNELKTILTKVHGSGKVRKM